MNRDETPTQGSRSVGGLSVDERLERIEEDLRDVGAKIDRILNGMSDSNTRFALADQMIVALSARVTKLEDGRDAVIKVVMFAVLAGLLGLIGIKVMG
jgi:hypothetical protein